MTHSPIFTRARRPTLHDTARLMAAPPEPGPISPHITIEYGHRVATRPYRVEFTLDTDGTLLSRYLDPATPWEDRTQRDSMNREILEALELLLRAYIHTDAAADAEGGD